MHGEASLRSQSRCTDIYSRNHGEYRSIQRLAVSYRAKIGVSCVLYNYRMVRMHPHCRANLAQSKASAQLWQPSQSTPTGASQTFSHRLGGVLLRDKMIVLKASMIAR